MLVFHFEISLFVLQRPFPGSMVTPGEGIEQLDVLRPPRKRRKRPKTDLCRKLSDQKMISNLANVDDIVRDRVRVSS